MTATNAERGTTPAATESTGSIARVERTCRSCGSEHLEQVVAFGPTPLADRLLRADQLDEPELTADLTFVVCRECALAQILESVDPEVLFFSDYPYFSSVSPRLMAHFTASAEAIIERRGLTSTSTVVEAASNDGYMLTTFQRHGCRVLGIDPAVGPAHAALEKGIPTRIEFFGLDLARQLVADGLHADVFLGNNVLAHVPDLNGFVAGIATILAPDGIAVIEAPYVVDLVDNVEFDTIYHQHHCYFSVTALVELFHRHGLSLNDIEHTTIHGGSLRLFVEPVEHRRPVIDEMLATERNRGFDGASAYLDFADRIDDLRHELRRLLDDVKSDGSRIAGYAAAAKATTLMAYCGIGANDLDYICDLSEHKHGRFMCGNKLPIVPPATLLEDRPDYTLILAWNFADEIMRQNAEYAAAGGRFIVPVPVPRVVE